MSERRRRMLTRAEITKKRKACITLADMHTLKAKKCPWWRRRSRTEHEAWARVWLAVADALHTVLEGAPFNQMPAPAWGEDEDATTGVTP